MLVQDNHFLPTANRTIARHMTSIPGPVRAHNTTIHHIRWRNSSSPTHLDPMSIGNAACTFFQSMRPLSIAHSSLLGLDKHSWPMSRTTQQSTTIAKHKGPSQTPCQWDPLTRSDDIAQAKHNLHRLSTADSIRALALETAI